jgi:hypothetical protein
MVPLINQALSYHWRLNHIGPETPTVQEEDSNDWRDQCGRDDGNALSSPQRLRPGSNEIAEIVWTNYCQNAVTGKGRNQRPD